MSFEAQILTRHGAIYRCQGETVLQAVGTAYSARRRLGKALPGARFRFRVICPNGARLGSGDVAAAIRTVRVLSGEISRRADSGAAGGGGAAPSGGAICVVTQQISLNSDKNEVSR